NGRTCLASMGIYLFNKSTLLEVLEKTQYKDFGKEVFPTSIRTKHVQVHLFDGYWEDIGTIRSFFEANLSLTSPDAPFTLAHDRFPTFTRSRFLPSCLFHGANINSALVADGCYIEEGAVIENSIIGLRCMIKKGAVIRNSIIMGNDYYLTNEQRDEDRAVGLPDMGIGENTIIEGAIVDKNCRIGNNVVITNPGKISDTEEQAYGMIRDGVICIPKETVIHDGYIVAS
ncbi:MAG: sugar phosphate nucleotidyltransferase, partial [Thermoguttaceae bacterium]